MLSVFQNLQCNNIRYDFTCHLKLLGQWCLRTFGLSAFPYFRMLSIG